MKKVFFTGTLLLILSGAAMAQKKDSVNTAKPLVELGAKADRHLGKELQKASLTKPPVRLSDDSTGKKKITSEATPQKKTKKKTSGNKS